jgi:hypothetical protein
VNEPRPDLKARIAAILLPPAAVAERTRAIYEKVLSESRWLRTGNFTAIAVDDLERLFGLYDGAFFEGQLMRLVAAEAEGRLGFRLSKRMTKVGGTTTRHERLVRRPGPPRKRLAYEIAISTTLLFQTFGDIRRTIRVNGVECSDRLEALQRVFEHELLHLLEMLVWGDSSCSAENYKRLAARIFAHTDVTHQLVTQRERALANYQILLGDRVVFEYEGHHHAGIVNRITRRATVLVEDAHGAPYSDGRRYRKFYIPLAMLRKAVG